MRVQKREFEATRSRQRQQVRNILSRRRAQMVAVEVEKPGRRRRRQRAGRRRREVISAMVHALSGTSQGQILGLKSIINYSPGTASAFRVLCEWREGVGRVVCVVPPVLLRVRVRVGEATRH